MRVVHSKIQILGWVVVSYQDDHKIRVHNAGKNRFLVQGIKWNGMESDSLYQHLQIVSNDEVCHLSHDVESSRSLLRSYGSNPTKSKTQFIYNVSTQITSRDSKESGLQRELRYSAFQFHNSKFDCCYRENRAIEAF